MLGLNLRASGAHAPKFTSSKATPAQIGRDYCDQRFAAEKKIEELLAAERQQQRLAMEKPHAQGLLLLAGGAECSRCRAD